MRAIVLGGPGGQLNVMPAWRWRAVNNGGRVVVGDRVVYVNTRFRSWRPLFTFDPARASVSAAYDATFRRFELEP